MAAFNKVWTSPETLPTKEEIADPGRWTGSGVGPGNRRRRRLDGG